MTSYATREEFDLYGLPPTMTAGIPNVDKLITSEISAASDEADAALAEQFGLPLISWPESLKKAVCRIAALEVIKFRGFHPEGSDDVYISSAKSARDWLMSIAKSEITLPGVVDSTPDQQDTSAFVYTEPLRGWR